MAERFYELGLHGRKLAETLMGINRYMDPVFISRRLADSIKTVYHDLGVPEAGGREINKSLELVAEVLRAYARALSMFPMINNVTISINALVDLLPEGGSEPGVGMSAIIDRIVDIVKGEIDGSFKATVASCSRLLERESGNILMYGSSLLISECVKGARVKGRIYLLESQPWEEGKIAKRILRKNPRVMLYPDISLSHLVKDVVDLVVIGVDMLSINILAGMTGSYQVLLMGKEAGLEAIGVTYSFSLWHAGIRYDEESIPRVAKFYEWGDSVYVPIYDVLAPIFIDKLIVDSHEETVGSRDSIRLIAKRANFARRLRESMYKDELILKLLGER